MTHQNAARGGLTGDEFASPVFGLCHESPLELLLARLPGSLLLLLLGIIGRQFRLLTTAEEGEDPPQQHDEQSCQEGEDRGEEEAPPLPLLETLGIRWRGGDFDIVAYLAT